ncbi:MAG: hypothetical protein AB2L14_23135 [Candidatus Xenobiia bacterium LiM19]
MSYTYETLPVYDNLNRFSFAIEVTAPFFIRKGKMIAYYGNLRFEALGKSVFDMIVQHTFNAPLHVQNFVVVDGQGKLVLGDNYNDINSFDLTDGGTHHKKRSCARLRHTPYLQRINSARISYVARHRPLSCVIVQPCFFSGASLPGG